MRDKRLIGNMMSRERGRGIGVPRMISIKVWRILGHGGTRGYDQSHSILMVSEEGGG